MVRQWADWLDQRGRTGAFSRSLVERQLRLIIDTLLQMLGPFRREAGATWQAVSDHYGRMAASRGLAAGEVVEEMQQLRILLVRHISATVAAMRPRRAISVFLRLNSIIDRGVAQAVVGYTDALVASLLINEESEAASITATTEEDLERQLQELESELVLGSQQA